MKRIKNRDEAVSNTNRQFYRWHLQSNNIPLVFQSSGVPIKLYRRVFFYDSYIGRGIIKDISIGGVGFLSSGKLNKNIIIELPNGLKIKCTKQHQSQVNPQLIFNGASWDQSVYALVMPLLKQYSKQAYRPVKNNEENYLENQ